MKCPYCGGEAQGKVCEYCGSELPKEPVVINITNNYYDKAEKTDKEDKVNTVGRCPKCGASSISFSRERVRIGKNRGYRTVGVCQSCGHTWEHDMETPVKKSDKKTWLWVLGWIFIFPLPLTILLLRKKDMKASVKYGIIAAVWILYIVIGIVGNANTEPEQTGLAYETQPAQEMLIPDSET